MTRVDSEGRILLSKEVRERLGITPGTEVEVHEEDGKVVVEPENSPDEIIERMEQIINEASSDRKEAAPPVDEADDPIAQKHGDAVRKGAETHSDE